MTAETASSDAPTNNEPTMEEVAGYLRMVEALLFAATEPLDEASLSARLPHGADVPVLLAELVSIYENGCTKSSQPIHKWPTAYLCFGYKKRWEARTHYENVGCPHMVGDDERSWVNF
jgi:hypothetical protein